MFGWEDAWATWLFTFLIGPIFLADCFARSIRRSGQSSFPIPVGAASVGPAGQPHDEVKKVPKQVIPVVVLLLFFAVRRRQRTRWPFKRHGKMRAKPTVSGERAPPLSSGSSALHCRKWPHKSASALRQATNVNNPHCLSQPCTR